MAVGANFLNHPTALKNAAQITAETCDVIIKFETGANPTSTTNNQEVANK